MFKSINTLFTRTPGDASEAEQPVRDQFGALATAIGTHNLDNRSMRLNFEVTMLLYNKEFAKDVEAMLENDFSNAKLASSIEYTESSLPYRFLIRASRLTAPVQ